MIKKISEIKPDPNQPRKTFDDKSLKFLAESILSNGLLYPIDIDENNLLIDGERRWKAHKLAKLKEIECRIVKIGGNGKVRLRRQLTSDFQDEDVPTEERYEALVKLYDMEGNPTKVVFCKELGIDVITLTRALNYIGDKRKNPEDVEGISAGVWREIRTLPKEEREEIKKELKETNEPFVKIVKQKKEQIKERKEKEKIEKELEETRKELSKREIKITTDRDRAFQMREEIIETQNHFNRLISNVRWAKKTKFFFNKPKDKDNFIEFLAGASERARKWADELDDLREKIEIEIVKE